MGEGDPFWSAAVRRVLEHPRVRGMSAEQRRAKVIQLTEHELIEILDLGDTPHSTAWRLASTVRAMALTEEL